ncbi:hypothetical protein BC830DRAFT_1168902 [Chytriomyces sp. MP71]|nr:hypothetical protein BC830DRAFT_1168902 [Chytriomyces sp. MP71]
MPLAPSPLSCPVLAHPKKAFKIAVAAALSPKPYFVDLQVAQYLGKKSGREVLELFPSLSRRVATLAQKEQLSASPVGEAVLSALMECQRRDARLNETDTDGDEAVVRLPPRWIQWYERDGKRAMKLDDVDIQFLDAEEVLKEIQGLCASSKANKAAGARLEGLFDEDDSSVAAAVASRQQDEEDDEIEVEELELSKFAGVSVENRVVLDIAAAMGGRTDTKGLSAAAAEQQAASKGMAFHKFKKFGIVAHK